MCTTLVPWLLSYAFHGFRILTSVLQWWFLQVIDSLVYRAAEFRRTHPSRPPPEPDSNPLCTLLRLIIVLSHFSIVDSLSHDITNNTAFSPTPKMSDTNRNPPFAPLRGADREDEDSTIWKPPKRDMSDDLAGLAFGGGDDDDDVGLSGLSLGEEFDGETGFPYDSAVDKTVKKSNSGRRVSVDPDGLTSDDASVGLPAYSRIHSPASVPPTLVPPASAPPPQASFPPAPSPLTPFPPPPVSNPRPSLMRSSLILMRKERRSSKQC